MKHRLRPKHRCPRAIFDRLHKTLVNHPTSDLAGDTGPFEDIPLELLERSRRHFEKALQRSNDAFATFAFRCEGPVSSHTSRDGQDSCVPAVLQIGVLFLSNAGCHDTDIADWLCGSHHLTCRKQ
jgi:hypothetical protein